MSAYKMMLLSLHHRKEWIFSLISSFKMALRWWPHPELLVFTCMSPTFTSQPHPHLSSTRSNIAAVLYNASCAVNPSFVPVFKIDCSLRAEPAAELSKS